MASRLRRFQMLLYRVAYLTTIFDLESTTIPVTHHLRVSCGSFEMAKQFLYVCQTFVALI